MNTTVLAKAAMDFGERLGYAGRMLVIGMLIVFLALATLWGALSLFRLAITAFGKKGKKSPATALPKQEQPTPAPAPADDGALIAAITAAISVVLAEENGGACPAFRVVSFKRSRQ